MNCNNKLIDIYFFNTLLAINNIGINNTTEKVELYRLYKNNKYVVCVVKTGQ